MMTKRRLNLRRNNDRLVVAAPSAAEPTKLPPLSAVSTNSSKFSSNLAGRFYTDNSFEAHSREREREAEREAQKKAKQRAKATQNRRRRVEREMAKEAARIEAMERKLRRVPNDARLHKRKRHLPKNASASVLSPIDPNVRFNRQGGGGGGSASVSSQGSLRNNSLGSSSPGTLSFDERRVTIASPEGWEQDDDNNNDDDDDDNDAFSGFDVDGGLGGSRREWKGPGTPRYGGAGAGVEVDDDDDDDDDNENNNYRGRNGEGNEEAADSSRPFLRGDEGSSSPVGSALDRRGERGSSLGRPESPGALTDKAGADFDGLDFGSGSSEDGVAGGGEAPREDGDPEGIYDGDGNWFGDLGSYLTEHATKFEPPPDGQSEPTGLDGVEPLDRRAGLSYGGVEGGFSDEDEDEQEPDEDEENEENEDDEDEFGRYRSADRSADVLPPPLSTASKRSAAARSIQALARGNVGRQRASIRRRRHGEKVARHRAAATIQSACRGRRDRSLVRNRRAQRRSSAALRIQVGS
jgi:hypothetical protein